MDGYYKEYPKLMKDLGRKSLIPKRVLEPAPSSRYIKYDIAGRVDKDRSESLMHQKLVSAPPERLNQRFFVFRVKDRIFYED